MILLSNNLAVASTLLFSTAVTAHWAPVARRDATSTSGWQGFSYGGTWYAVSSTPVKDLSAATSSVNSPVLAAVSSPGTIVNSSSVVTVTVTTTAPGICPMSSSDVGGINPSTISIVASSTISLPSGSVSIASSVASSTSISLPTPSSTSTPTPVPSGPNSSNGPAQPNFTFDQLYKLQTTFLDAFMYPNNAVQAKMINSSLFAENVKGRVDVTRTFDGPELNTEYLFGLFATLSLNPSAVSLLGYPINYTITHFAANQNIAAASVIVTFNFASLGVIVPVEVDTWNLFDADGKILQYDATFRWFQYLYDFLFSAVAPKINATTTGQVTTYFTRAIAQGICTTHQQYCNGTNTQYSSFADCANFITSQIRFGQAYELGMNTVLCRMVHENMVPYRPEVHCPHIGPTGGGMCVDDSSYPAKVLQPYFTNAPFVPYGYHDVNATVWAM